MYGERERSYLLHVPAHVAYPNGSSRWWSERLLTWNAGDCCGFAAEAGVDDVGFAWAVIEDVAEVADLDRTRAYATGQLVVDAA